ncbi:F0F1 ATP synthase subunit delta [Pelolinea submarina]|uniref:ATP synthase subunit b n=1 Tax=Pelolinea submarina TaxID=913107 RepID=A0A347ZV56_9CHLR|nr:F0F1 ATP synthase subunit delta [Pelolinea submarina]REG10227.1 ATP synthase B/B' subunit [Pelolinea submarina]BBB49187.1 F-type H+-transporting ATPase subunit b [Pelolinea submarina]
MLEIDLVTILFQIINFVVLAAALYFLLFKRMIKKADQRKQEAEVVRQESLQNLEESKKLRVEAEDYLSNISQKVDEHIEKAKQEIEQHREQVLQLTKEEAEEIYKQRKEDSIRTQKRTVEKFRKKILDTIVEVSQQTLQLTTPDEIHHLLIKQMNERVWDLGKSEMRRVETIRKSLADREPILEIHTAKPLTREEKAQAIRTFSALADKNVKLELDTDPDLVAGLRVRLGDFIVDNSLATKLNEISENTLQQLSDKLDKLEI